MAGNCFNPRPESRYRAQTCADPLEGEFQQCTDEERQRDDEGPEMPEEERVDNERTDASGNPGAVETVQGKVDEDGIEDQECGDPRKARVTRQSCLAT